MQTAAHHWVYTSAAVASRLVSVQVRQSDAQSGVSCEGGALASPVSGGIRCECKQPSQDTHTHMHTPVALSRLVSWEVCYCMSWHLPVEMHCWLSVWCLHDPCALTWESRHRLWVFAGADGRWWECCDGVAQMLLLLPLAQALAVMGLAWVHLWAPPEVLHDFDARLHHQ